MEVPQHATNSMQSTASCRGNSTKIHRKARKELQTLKKYSLRNISTCCLQGQNPWF